MLEVRMERLIARYQRLQQERLEKPSGMGQMPLRRAGINDGLHAEIFDRERPTQGFGLGSNRAVLGHAAVGHGNAVRPAWSAQKVCFGHCPPPERRHSIGKQPL